MSDALMATYRRLPVGFVRGEGAWLWDREGKRYLDAISGIAVCGLGHAHPAIRDAICSQAQALIHTSNLYNIDEQQALARELVALSEMDKVFFANSGAEANEAAIKIARLFGHKQGIDVPGIVVMEDSFHGRTLATLSATGNRRVQAGFEPLVQGFVRVPYDDAPALNAVAEHSPNVVAVMLEPIQGEGGVNIPDDGYLDEVRRICDQHGWLLILDEIQTGIGRTGRMFAFQHSSVRPDVMTLAKGLGNGIPIGACLARGEAADILSPGTHGSTFGGNPLACRAGRAVLEVLRDRSLVARARDLGTTILDALRARLSGCAGVTAIRGKGLMIGIELAAPCAALVPLALEKGLLINVTADTVVRLLPPLILSDSEAERLVETLGELIETFLDSAEFGAGT